MNEIVKRDIITVLTKLTELLKKKENADILEAKELSNHVIHNASIFQDEDSISIAVLVYSLSKIMEREKDIDYTKLLNMINACILSLNEDRDDDFRRSIKNLFSFIRTLDKKISMYINEVINQAQIKKGCKLCEHGVSVARASEVLGISQWELMHYLGKTMIIDHFSEPVNVSLRLKLARSIFS